VAIVICNEIVEDKWTNNKSLFGIFNGITVAALPAVHPRLFVLASLTDGRGEWPVTLEIGSPSGSPAFKATLTCQFADPLAVHDLVIQVRNLPLVEAGEYHVLLTCPGRLLGRRRFAVMVQPEP
jgi:hypothetical protein